MIRDVTYGEGEPGEESIYEESSEASRLEASRLKDPLRSLSLRPPVIVPLGCRLGEVIRKMREAQVGSCLIEDANGILAGIFTERDLLTKAPLEGVNLDEMQVDDFMQPNPETLTPDHPIAYALNRMAGGGYRNIPLVDDDNRAVGLVTLRDIVEEVSEHFSDEVFTLPPTRRSAPKREGA